MRRSPYVCIAIVVAVLAAGCGSSDRGVSNTFGDCTFAPKTVCTGQNLEAVGAAFTDLAGADFTDAKMSGADLRKASLRDAILVRTDLSAADLTGADLTGADLTDTILFRATLTDVQWPGANPDDARYCQTVMPDGTISECKDLQGGSVPPRRTGAPPRIVRAEPAERTVCIVDGMGEGVEIVWRVRNAGSVVFSVDDVRLGEVSGRSGVKRVPFPCDGELHAVRVQAFGQVAPSAETSFPLRVDPPTDR